MNEYLNKNKKIAAIIFGLINISLAYLSSYYLIFAFFIPIFTAIKLWELDDKNKIIFLFTSGLFSSIMNMELTIYILFPMIIYGNFLYDLIKRNKTDKFSLKVLTIIMSVLSLAIIGYLYNKYDIKIVELTKEFEKIISKQNIKIENKMIENSIKTIPSFVIIFSLIYSLISLKLVRNYLNFKYKNIRDLRKINSFRIVPKDLIIIFISLILAIIICKLLKLSNEFIILNSIVTLKSIFVLNGAFLLDYYISFKKSKVSKIINWFFIFLLFTYISEAIALIGILDIFINLRKKVRVA
ncbi:DUF2232 domain-containing protein [Anaerococcus hydrogenalis]|uniref:DUF2232 domain-containing protein n=1 Tax=Anaerococcus hydrogenalis TaxID=33029 RepID=UPI002904F2D1|nr:DUF2232 domain-containing protein [Anaerococcus hydrogenalis]MDU1315952.1 DUF2232 domain-containing protein [Anaerococcus hydrogenalis]